MVPQVSGGWSLTEATSRPGVRGTPKVNSYSEYAMLPWFCGAIMYYYLLPGRAIAGECPSFTAMYHDVRAAMSSIMTHRYA